MERKVETNTIRVCKNAESLLSKLKIGPNTAIVFDIDDTLINPRTGALITPVYNLYKRALDLDLVPFIVTARIASHYNILVTKNDLSRKNITYKNLFLRSEKCSDPAHFKYKSREKITRDGYTIIMSVGDMDWDITGGFHGIGVKIPSQSI